MIATVAATTAVTATMIMTINAVFDRGFPPLYGGGVIGGVGNGVGVFGGTGEFSVSR